MKKSRTENPPITRRQFLKDTTVLASAAWITSNSSELPAPSIARTAADQVILGNTGIKLSRVGIGSGTNGGNLQRSLGREGFNHLIRYALDQGITYIDTSESYGTHTWVCDAIKGIPREKLFIQSKVMQMGFRRSSEDPLKTIDRFRLELGMDYIDSLLIHCQITPDWDEQNKYLLDAFAEAKQKKIIRAHGVSCHSLPATTKAAQLDWVNVNLVRINPQGVNMDTSEMAVFGTSDESHVPAVVEQIKIMRQNGHGIIGMKLLGEGAFKTIEERRKSLTWIMKSGLVDAVVLGLKNTREIDEALRHINSALA